MNQDNNFKIDWKYNALVKKKKKMHVVFVTGHDSTKGKKALFFLLCMIVI